MKLISNLALLVFTILACPGISHAFPALGDDVKFVAMYQNSPVVIEKTIISQDTIHNTFTVHNRMTYQGRVIQDQTAELPFNFLYTPEKISHVIATCESREGAVSDMVVAGTKMKVCEFYNEDSQLTDILGPVPFGQIRFQMYLEGEEFLDFNLTKFK